jgi:ATP-dependent RNA helicase RhlE
MYHISKIEKLIREKIPVQPLPEDLEIVETPAAEAREMAKEIDSQKKKDDPTFQGAFHERKGSKKKRRR